MTMGLTPICLYGVNNQRWCHNAEQEWVYHFKGNQIPTRMQVIWRQEPRLSPCCVSPDPRCVLHKEGKSIPEEINGKHWEISILFKWYKFTSQNFRADDDTNLFQVIFLSKSYKLVKESKEPKKTCLNRKGSTQLGKEWKLRKVSSWTLFLSEYLNPLTSSASKKVEKVSTWDSIALFSPPSLGFLF